MARKRGAGRRAEDELMGKLVRPPGNPGGLKVLGGDLGGLTPPSPRAPRVKAVGTSSYAPAAYTPPRSASPSAGGNDISPTTSGTRKNTKIGKRGK